VRSIHQLIRQSVIAPLSAKLLDCTASSTRLSQAHLTWQGGDQPIGLITAQEPQV